MTRYCVYCSALLALSLLLADAGASQAGIFGRWRARYDYQPRPAAATTTAQPAPVANPATAAPAGPIAYSAAKPITAAAPTPSVVAPQSTGVYVPQTGTANGAAWSVAPRSSWDFGSFPPYSR